MSGNGATRVDEELFDTLGAGDLPPPCPELEEELSQARPVATRRPLSQLALMGGLSLAYAGLLVLLLSLRRDLGALPLSWVASYAALWLISFVGLAYVATVPRRGEVMPRWRRAGALGAIALVLFMVAGFAWAPAAAGLSIVHPPTFGALVDYSQRCLKLGLATAVVPVALAALCLRGAVPTGSRWVGFAAGVAGGALGALVVHFHCAVSTPLHAGIVHTAMILAAGLIGALVIPRVAR